MPDLPAGRFAPWLAQTQLAIRGVRDTDVPCDGCTACCRASQFVHVAADERDAIAHIPKALLFPAPGMPRGHFVVGYDERGHCPLLVDDGCSIYEHRPRACRAFDCRVFAATGIELDDDDKREVMQRAAQWRFECATAEDRARRDALQTAVTFLRDHEALGPLDPTAIAVRAVEIHHAFVPAQLGSPAMAAVVNHLTFSDPIDTELFAAAERELAEKMRAVDGFRGFHVVQSGDREAILVILGDSTDVLDRLATEVGSPWMREHVLPLLAEPPRRYVGETIASAEA